MTSPPWNNPDADAAGDRRDPWVTGPHRSDCDDGLPCLPEAAPPAGFHRLIALFRDNPPPEPTPEAWQSTLHRIQVRLRDDRCSGGGRWLSRPGGWLLAGVLTAAAALGGVVLARGLWPFDGRTGGSVARATDEVLPVVHAGEVNILHMDARDADRVITGQPLLGSFDLAGEEDIEVVQVEPDQEDGRMPALARGAGRSLIVVAHADDPEEP
ncbi:MAG: hypothetical protein U0736_04645 [Gemmataceae bacterium]